MKKNHKILFIYLFFVLVMTVGAAVWQLVLPNLATKYSAWNMSIGWQREIALWNVGVDLAIIVTLIKKDVKFAQILTFAATALCFLLGGNHLITAMTSSGQTNLHWLGAIEVLGLAGFGFFALYNTRFFHS